MNMQNGEWGFKAEMEGKIVNNQMTLDDLGIEHESCMDFYFSGISSTFWSFQKKLQSAHMWKRVVWKFFKSSLFVLQKEKVGKE